MTRLRRSSLAGVQADGAAIGLVIAMRGGGHFRLVDDVTNAMAELPQPGGGPSLSWSRRGGHVEHAIAEFMTLLWQAVAIICGEFHQPRHSPRLVIALAIPLTLAIVLLMELTGIDMQWISSARSLSRCFAVG